MNIVKIAISALALAAGLPGSVAQAQQSPTSTWNDSVGWRNTGDRAIDLERAKNQEIARRGGFGPGNVITTYEGQVTFNETNEYKGAVTNNQATTATNLNSFASTLNQTGTGNSSGVTFTTGNTAWQTNQNATAANANSGAGAANNGIGSTNN